LKKLLRQDNVVGFIHVVDTFQSHTTPPCMTAAIVKKLTYFAFHHCHVNLFQLLVESYFTNCDPKLKEIVYFFPVNPSQTDNWNLFVRMLVKHPISNIMTAEDKMMLMANGFAKDTKKQIAFQKIVLEKYIQE